MTSICGINETSHVFTQIEVDDLVKERVTNVGRGGASRRERRGWTLVSLPGVELRAAAPERAVDLLDQAAGVRAVLQSWGIERCNALAGGVP